jgi:hypothetical protein
MLLKIWDAIRAFVFHLQDLNEDYTCMRCGKPTRPRYLYCSNACAEQDEQDDTL